MLPTEGRPGLAGLTGVGSLVQKFGAKIRRRAILDRAVRPARVVVVAESPRDALRFEHAGEQFTVEALVPESSVERLVDSILPRTGWLDEAGRDAGRFQPRLEKLGDELTAIVTAQMAWRPVPRHGGLEGCHDLATAHPAAGHDVEVEVAVFVQERQELHGRTVLRGVEDHVDAPHVVDAIGLDLRPWPRRRLGPHHRARDLQARPPPHALHRAQRTAQPLPGQDGMHPPVAIARVRVRQLQDRSLQLHRAWRGRQRRVVPRRAPEPEVATSLPPRTPLRGHHTAGRPAFLRRAYHFFPFTSLSTWICSAWSATSRFSRTFSSRSPRSCCSSLKSIPPYWRFHRWKVAALMFVSRHTLATVSPLSDRRRIATICSGVCLFPFGIWVLF